MKISFSHHQLTPYPLLKRLGAFFLLFSLIFLTVYFKPFEKEEIKENIKIASQSQAPVVVEADSIAGFKYPPPSTWWWYPPWGDSNTPPVPTGVLNCRNIPPDGNAGAGGCGLHISHFRRIRPVEFEYQDVILRGPGYFIMNGTHFFKSLTLEKGAILVSTPPGLKGEIDEIGLYYRLPFFYKPTGIAAKLDPNGSLVHLYVNDKGNNRFWHAYFAVSGPYGGPYGWEVVPDPQLNWQQETNVTYKWAIGLTQTVYFKLEGNSILYRYSTGAGWVDAVGQYGRAYEEGDKRGWYYKKGHAGLALHILGELKIDQDSKIDFSSLGYPGKIWCDGQGPGGGQGVGRCLGSIDVGCKYTQPCVIYSNCCDVTCNTSCDGHDAGGGGSFGSQGSKGWGWDPKALGSPGETYVDDQNLWHLPSRDSEGLFFGDPPEKFFLLGSSGGGTRCENWDHSQMTPGEGGGRIKIVAQTLTLSGQILANGGRGNGGNYKCKGFAAGSGSGGSIFIDVDNFNYHPVGTTKAVIWAKGGGRVAIGNKNEGWGGDITTVGGCGGSGRIKIRYKSSTVDPKLLVSNKLISTINDDVNRDGCRVNNQETTDTVSIEHLTLDKVEVYCLKTTLRVGETTLCSANASDSTGTLIDPNELTYLWWVDPSTMASLSQNNQQVIYLTAKEMGDGRLWVRVGWYGSSKEASLLIKILGVSISGDIYAKTMGNLQGLLGGDVVAWEKGQIPNFGKWKIGDYSYSGKDIPTLIEEVKKRIGPYSPGFDFDPQRVLNQMSTQNWTEIPPEGLVYRCTGSPIWSGSSGFKGKVTLIIEGNLTISANIQYSPNPSDPHSLGIIATEGITVKETVSHLDGAYLAGKEINFKSQKTDVNGLLVAGDKITLPKSGTIKYDPNLVKNPPPGFREVFKAIFKEVAP